MNKKELQALRLMEELDGLRDDFIEAAMLPDDEVSKGTSRATGISRGFRRIMKNGLVAALLERSHLNGSEISSVMDNT